MKLKIKVYAIFSTRDDTSIGGENASFYINYDTDNKRPMVDLIIEKLHELKFAADNLNYYSVYSIDVAK